MTTLPAVYNQLLHHITPKPSHVAVAAIATADDVLLLLLRSCVIYNTVMQPSQPRSNTNVFHPSRITIVPLFFSPVAFVCLRLSTCQFGGKTLLSIAPRWPPSSPSRPSYYSLLKSMDAATRAESLPSELQRRAESLSSTQEMQEVCFYA